MINYIRTYDNIYLICLILLFITFVIEVIVHNILQKRKIKLDIIMAQKNKNVDSIQVEEEHKEIIKEYFDNKYYVEVYLDLDKKYRFQIINNENKLFGESRKYGSKGTCINGIFTFMNNINRKTVNNLNNDYNKKFGESYIEINKVYEKYIYRLISSNNSVMFESEQYDTYLECSTNIKLIRKGLIISGNHLECLPLIKIKNDEVRIW